jgi:triosephosphate isomerase (TIM)
MRKQIIAGNWKMNGTLSETANLINGLKQKIRNRELTREVVLCPPFTSLILARELIKETPFKLGAQNVHFEQNGAYTGEISAGMLRETGCEYVIIGHSERRTYFHEDDAFINKKVKTALAAGLKVILCVGETLEERDKDITRDIVKTQTTGSLRHVSEHELENVIIAYEPVWAIGTGKTATPQQANDVHEYIRSIISVSYSQAAAERIVIQYGGSVKPENAKELLSMSHIDGALVGGASLKSGDFSDIFLA